MTTQEIQIKAEEISIDPNFCYRSFFSSISFANKKHSEKIILI